MDIVGHMNKSHLTAIIRKNTSPVYLQLEKMGIFWMDADILDYGCGLGEDATRFGLQKFDPYYYPDFPNTTFDTIICNYVLNVIPDESERKSVLRNIGELLNDTGEAFIAVRRDRKKLRGLTARGTWQGYVELPKQFSVYKNANFEIYNLTKDDIRSIVAP